MIMSSNAQRWFNDVRKSPMISTPMEEFLAKRRIYYFVYGEDSNPSCCANFINGLMACNGDGAELCTGHVFTRLRKTP